ncbi:MAG: hypothetical protein L3J74_16515 [Bacteroidales bacterium]|nr:hypothetical protein [Bacteroidales bacterium]
MKKTFITLIFLLGMLNINAQFSFDAKMNIGLNGIFSINPEINPNTVEFSSGFSYNIGVSGAISLWQKGDFVVDLLYFDKRSEVRWLLGLSYRIPDYTISFKYLSIPSYFRFKATKKFSIGLGYVSNIYIGHKAGTYDEVKANTYTGGILFGLEYQVFPKINIGINAQTDIMPFANKLIEPVFENQNYYYNYNLMFSISYCIFSSKEKN